MARVKTSSSWLPDFNAMFKKFAEQWNFSTQTLMHAMAYAGGGFLTGFIVKKFGNMLVLCILSCIVVGYILHQYEIVFFNWYKFQQMLGFTMPNSLDDLAHQIMSWIQSHKLESIAGTIGFLVGYKFG